MDSETRIRECLHQKGNLHDCRIDRLLWDPLIGKLELSLVDVNAGFFGLPEYGGAEPAMLLLTGVSALELGVSPLNPKLSIYEVTIQRAAGDLEVEISFWPGGRLKAVCQDVVLLDALMA